MLRLKWTILNASCISPSSRNKIAKVNVSNNECAQLGIVVDQEVAAVSTEVTRCIITAIFLVLGIGAVLWNRIHVFVLRRTVTNVRN